MTRIIKLGLISAIAFSMLLLAFSLLIPSTIRVSRAVDIEAPRSRIEETMRSDTSWNELAGQKLKGEFSFHESAGITVVQWHYDFKLKWYPWEKFSAITFDTQLGPVMERSLNNLKKRVENSP